jgi:DMSO/TMAO reductase YedYZ molybdopterin-dependent catalytic subunit
MLVAMSGDEVIRSPDVERKNRVPPGQKITDHWPVLHYGQVPRVDPSQWKLTISGLVKRELRLSYEEFLSLPRVRVLSDVHCVTGWSYLDNLWEGVSTGEIKRLAGLKPEARFVIVHAEGGFTTNLSVEDFFQPDVLFAIKHNGKTLTPEHGYPVRLVVPRLYFWKSAKWVTGVEFTAEDRPGFWETHGYHNRGDPWKEERYSTTAF